uniref:PITH domain-containing protein n=1 Tax=Schistosoma japonicum TaxID=6182 RepID=Q5D940_SCHJA|nr:unknown [Schistosoma japonicum]
MCDHNIGGHCCHSHKADDSPLFSLYKFIDTLNVECLNESIPGSGKRVFKPYEERKDSTVYVESDVDQELLFNVPFTGSVKLMSIIISGVDNENHPSQVSLYKNKPYMTFEDLDVSSFIVKT